MIRILLPFILCCAHLALHAAPAPGRPPRGRPVAAPDGERFLFIVETSSGTGRIQAETEAALFNLIASGVNQEMRPGDTYGVWTFGKQLTAGDFPLQVWDSRNAQQLGTIAAAYLSDRDFEKSADVANMMSSLKTVIHSISNLNVFIISKGDTPIAGTPFDKAINAEYKAKKSERNKAGKPYVTTLVVRDGWIIDSSVVVAGASIRLPERQIANLADKKPAAPPVPPAPVPSQAAAPVQSPATSEPAAVAASTPPAPAPKPRVMQIITKTNSVVTPPAPSPEVATIAPTNTPAAASPASDVPPAPPTGIAATAAPATPPPAVPPPAVPAPQSSPASTPVAVLDASPGEPLPLESALAALLPKPLEVSARERASGDGAPGPAATPNVQAAALPAAVGVQSGLMFAFGALLLSAAIFLLVLVLRRQRPVPQGSLITQSMNQR